MTAARGGTGVEQEEARPPHAVVRVLTWPFLALVRLYQVVISPTLAPSCRYYPSCSSYSVGALRRFGPLWGTWLTARRLARCHPWCDGGVDHVPPRDERGRPDWAAHAAAAALLEQRLETSLAEAGTPARSVHREGPEASTTDSGGRTTHPTRGMDRDVLV